MISEDKTRTGLIINSKLKEELEAIAKKENRSFNNLCATILEQYVKNYK